ncbi:uncharacterized protein EI90DRAFT_2428944 [Cantharellus anzutake]|uniref:uncharacterized protein n=1 Tax=Cantharellus anzutake TaxID=1750568 RepID=UPI0019049E6C|nr:uncharacterized protein EI90DRAFT_2428944 [Cantharellus anzutake]KAF8338922.1 hypothetical protein EI90DRAFT_2428944 [Cantharellus anzutake]
MLANIATISVEDYEEAGLGAIAAPGKHWGRNRSRYGARRRSRLSVLELHIDVICVILDDPDITSHDLLRLVMVNKTFRLFLLRPSSSFIWKNVRDHLPIKTPNPHPSLTEHTWAQFLYRPKACEASFSDNPL